MSCKKTLLVKSKILRLFITTLTADEKYSLLNRDSITQPIQMQLSQKQKEFSGFSLQRLKSSLNFEHFRKQHEPHSWCISDVTDSKKHDRSMSSKSRFRRNFEKQLGKRAQTRLKSLRQQLYHTYWSRSRQLSFKKSLLVVCKILKFFVKRFIADDKYSLLIRDNLAQPIMTQLSQKQIIFRIFFSTSEISFKSRTFPKKRWPS